MKSEPEINQKEVQIYISKYAHLTFSDTFQTLDKKAEIPMIAVGK